MTSRPSTAAPILVVLAILLVTLAAYVGGYFLLGKRRVYVVLTEGVPPHIKREFPNKTIAFVYRPAAIVESCMTGSQVSSAEVNPYGQ
jgi:hypothetical protein